MPVSRIARACLPRRDAAAARSPGVVRFSIVTGDFRIRAGFAKPYVKLRLGGQRIMYVWMAVLGCVDAAAKGPSLAAFGGGVAITECGSRFGGLNASCVIFRV